jgi:hypothetical protein
LVTPLGEFISMLYFPSTAMIFSPFIRKCISAN